MRIAGKWDSNLAAIRHLHFSNSLEGAVSAGGFKAQSICDLGNFWSMSC
jgi:hypothetical protein